MNRSTAVIIVLSAVIAGLLIHGDSLEGFGIGLILGLVLGALVGAAFTFREPVASDIRDHDGHAPSLRSF